MELTRRGAIRLAGTAGLAAAAGLVLAAAPASPAQAAQNGWRWCRQCQGLWFAGNPTLGVCPATGTAGHSFTGSGNYTLPLTSDVFNGDQDGWFWCAQCAGLWFGLSPTTGECPAPTPGTTGRASTFMGSRAVVRAPFGLEAVTSTPQSPALSKSRCATYVPAPCKL